MKLQRITVAVILFWALLIQPGLFGARLYDSIVIEISNKVITNNEVQLAISLKKQQLALQNMPAQDDETLKKEFIKGKIQDLLLEAEAEQLNLQVSQEELNDEINRYKRRLGKSEEDSLEDIFKSLNTTATDFKTNIYRVILRNKIIQSSIYSKINTSDDYLQEVFNNTQVNNYTYTIRHILRRIPPAADDAAKEKATEDITYILDKLSQDKSQWDTMALTYSDDPSVKTNMGKLAPFQKDQIIEELALQVEKMDIGVITGPVKTPFGFHIVELLEKTAVKKSDFESAKQELKQKEQNRQYQEYLEKLIEELQKKYIIRVVDPAYQKYVDSAVFGKS